MLTHNRYNGKRRPYQTAFTVCAITVWFVITNRTIRDCVPRFLRCGTAARDRDRTVKVNSFQNRPSALPMRVKCKMALIYELRAPIFFYRTWVSLSLGTMFILAGNKWHVGMLVHFARVNSELHYFFALFVVLFRKNVDIKMDFLKRRMKSKRESNQLFMLYITISYIWQYKSSLAIKHVDSRQVKSLTAA